MTANQIVIWLVVNTYLAMQMYSVISRHEKNEKICEIEKTKNARMKRGKLLFSNQNARKLLSTDLVNTKFGYFSLVFTKSVASNFRAF